PVPPAVEALLRLVAEPKEGDPAGLVGVGIGAEQVGLQPVEPLEQLVGRLPRRRVRPAVHVDPVGAQVRPDQELEALHEPVVPGARRSGGPRSRSATWPKDRNLLRWLPRRADPSYP